MGGKGALTTSGLGAGPHSVTAQYGGDAGFMMSTSEPVLFNVDTKFLITGNHPGGLIVAPGSTVMLSNATIGGAVVVQTGGSLDVEQSTIDGSVLALRPGSVRVCDSAVHGSLLANDARGLVLIGDREDDACGPDTIGGALNLRNNHHGVEAIGNHVYGLVMFSGNSGAGSFPEDTGPELFGNGP
jgi:hypothetical protein